MFRSITSILALFICVSVGAQTTIYVNYEHGPGGDGSSWESPFSQIQQALDVAEDGDEIWITSGTYRTGIDPSVSFNVDNSVSIYGGFAGDESSKDSRSEENEATILDGDLLVTPTLTQHLMKVAEDVELKLDNITFTNSDASDEDTPYGGAIYSQAKNIIIEHCRFINNKADERGGAIYCTDNHSLTIDHSYFENNNATRTAAIAFMKEGGLLEIENTRFTGSSDARNLIYVDSCVTTIRQCSFDNHTNIIYGLISSPSDRHFTGVYSCEFTENNNTQIMSIAGSASLTDIAIYNNENDRNHTCYFYGENASIIVHDFVYEDNLNSNSVLYFSDVIRAILSNTTFRNLNDVSASSCVYFSGNELTMDSVYFHNISGSSQLCMNAMGESLLMKNCDFEDITANGGPGAGFLSFDEINMQHSSFTNCNGSDGGQAGVFYTVGDFMRINSCIFEDNTASTAGVFFSASDKVMIDSSSFTNNNANQYYGCFVSQGNDSTLIQNTTFQDNHADINAAAFEVSNQCHIHQCLFSGNTSSAEYSNYGGTLRGSNFLITASTFEENKASHGTIFAMSNIEIRNSLLKNNYSDTSNVPSAGGTLRSRGQITCIGNVFDNNLSNTGGAIYHVNQSPSYFISNTIINNETFDNRSGAFWFSEDADVHFLNNLVWENGDSAIYFEEGQDNLTDHGGNISDQEEWFSGDFIVDFIDDYTPATSSSMVDAGVELDDSLQYSTDLFDNPRIQNEAIDIGAVESPYSIPTSSITKENSQQSALYPNPVQQRLYFNENPDQISVFTSNGSLIYEEEQPVSSIQTDNWDAGLYIVRLKHQNTSKTYKIVKE